MDQSPPRYSPDQVQRYFQRIRLPVERRRASVESLGPAEALQCLADVQKYQLMAVPFENLQLHYSEERRVSIHAEDVFEKIVGSGERGGYCMENNLLFATVLRSLGFTLWTAGGRVYQEGSYSGWGHMVVIVTIGQDQYMVDTGFGGNGPTQPLRLNRDGGKPTEHIGPSAARLVWKNIDGSTVPGQKLWCYQVRINDASDWQEMYCFPELEFLPRDYEGMNWNTYTSPRSIFVRELICVKMIFDEEVRRCIGVVILQDGLKRREHGQTILKKAFQNEAERVKTLADEFGIHLSARQQAAIRGLPTALGNRSFARD